jgi:hypothetical protein
LLISATRSPGAMPAAMSPAAAAATSSRNWAHVTSCQASPARRANWTVSGATTALSHTGSVRLAASPIVATGGTANSRTSRLLDEYTHGSLPSMTDTSTQSIEIAAPVDRIAAVICDFPRYPEWVSAVKAVDVREEYEDGYASQVHFALDAGIASDEYTLRYEYAEDISRIEWQLVAPSKLQRAQQGSYDLTDNGDGTSTVTYTLSVELAIGMLGMFKRKAEKMIMDSALKELKRRVESLS